MKQEAWVTCLPFVLAATVAAISSGCRAGPPKYPFVQPSDPFVAASGERLQSLEQAWVQEEGRRGRLVELVSPLAGVLARLPTGDPLAIDQAREEVRMLSQELEQKKLEAESLLAGPRAEVNTAEKALEKAEQETQQATRAEAGMAGTLPVGPTKARCGGDGCGGDCGNCDWSEACFELYCRCLPNCGNKDCGPDGCGGVCGMGSCGDGSYCDASGSCRRLPTQTDCRPDCRGIPRGEFTQTTNMRDFSATRKRGLVIDKLGTMADAEKYLEILKKRRDHLQEQIGGNETLTSELEQTRGLTDQTKAAIELATKEIPAAKKELTTARAGLNKLPAEELPAAEAAVKAQEEALAAREAALAQLKTEAASLAAKAKALDAQIRKVAREMPDIQDGRARIELEIASLVAEILTWKRLKLEVAEREARVAEAKRAGTKAKEKLEEAERTVAERHREVDKEYTPLMESANKKLAALMQPAFSEILVGDAKGNGLNVESRHLLMLRDEGRTGRTLAAVASLRDSRRTGWEKLPVELRESYPNWHREVVMLGDYHYFLGELELSTRRALRLEEQLVAERERLTKLVEADRTVADNSNQD